MERIIKNICEQENAAFEPVQGRAVCLSENVCQLRVKVLLLLRTLDFLAVQNGLDLLP